MAAEFCLPNTCQFWCVCFSNFHRFFNCFANRDFCGFKSSQDKSCRVFKVWMKETTWHMKQGGAQTLFQNYQGRVDFYYADLIKNLKYMTDNQRLSLYPSTNRSSIFHLSPLLKRTPQQIWWGVFYLYTLKSSWIVTLQETMSLIMRLDMSYS